MLKKLYVHNFRCLQNFELNINQLNSALIFGKNGAGKTTIFNALSLFQQIGRGVTPLRDLIEESDWFGWPDVADIEQPLSFEIEAIINDIEFKYQLMIKWPDYFKEPKIIKEVLIANAKAVISRDEGQVVLNDNAHFLVDWHHVALPIISVRSEKEPVAIFRDWLKKMIILSPCPRFFQKESKLPDSQLQRNGENLLDWARDLTNDHPHLFVPILEFLKVRMVDLETFRWNKTGLKERSLEFTFKYNDKTNILQFSQLSDGEKIFFLSACLLATKTTYPEMVLLWDEPDNFISLIELSHFITEFRRAFELNGEGQLIITSHSEKVMHEFSDNNSFYVSRTSHSSPTRIELLQDKSYQSSSIADAYYNGELEWE